MNWFFLNRGAILQRVAVRAGEPQERQVPAIGSDSENTMPKWLANLLIKSLTLAVVLLVLGCSSAPADEARIEVSWGERLCSASHQKNAPLPYGPHQSGNASIRDLLGSDIRRVHVTWYSPKLKNRREARRVLETRLASHPRGGTFYGYEPWDSSPAVYIKAVIILRNGERRLVEVGEVPAVCWQDPEGTYWWALLER